MPHVRVTRRWTGSAQDSSAVRFGTARGEPASDSRLHSRSVRRGELVLRVAAERGRARPNGALAHGRAPGPRGLATGRVLLLQRQCRHFGSPCRRVVAAQVLPGTPVCTSRRPSGGSHCCLPGTPRGVPQTDPRAPSALSGTQRKLTSAERRMPRNARWACRA